MPLRFLAQIGGLPLFQGRSASEIETFCTDGQEVLLKHRGHLFKAGEKAAFFAIVIQGALKLVRPTVDGDNSIVHFATPGDVIAGLVMGSPAAVFPVSAVAMGHSVLLRIPRDTYVKHWAGNASLQQCISGNLFVRMNQLQAQKAMVKAPLAQKIASQLVSLIERYSGENETILPIPLTRQEIADAVGSSVESVIRVMSEWSQKGYIETSDQLIHVLEMDKVVEIVKGVRQA